MNVLFFVNSLPGNMKLVPPIILAVIALVFIGFGALRPSDNERASDPATAEERPYKPVFIDQLDPTYVAPKANLSRAVIDQHHKKHHASSSHKSAS